MITMKLYWQCLHHFRFIIVIPIFFVIVSFWKYIQDFDFGIVGIIKGFKQIVFFRLAAAYNRILPRRIFIIRLSRLFIPTFRHQQKARRRDLHLAAWEKPTRVVTLCFDTRFNCTHRIARPRLSDRAVERAHIYFKCWRNHKVLLEIKKCFTVG